MQGVLTFLTAVYFYPHADMRVPSLWMESKILGVDWRVKIVVNGSVDVDVTTKYLNVVKFIKT